MSSELLHSAFSITSGPTVEPVSVAEARAQCSLDASDFDELLSGYIRAARELVEADAAVALMARSCVLRLDRFPCEQIEIPLACVTAVSSIQYVAMDGTTQTWSSSDYVVDLISLPVRIRPKFGLIWPVSLPQLNAVSVAFTAGASSVSDVPQVARQAMLLLIAEWWKNREESTAQKVSDPAQSAYQRLVGRLKWGRYP